MDYFKAQTAFLATCNFSDPIKESMKNGLVTSYMCSRDPEIKTYLSEQIIAQVKDSKALKCWEDYKVREASYSDRDLAPDFTYNDINGQPVSLSDFKVKMIYIDIWAIWCGPCVKGMPYFKKVRDNYKGKDIVFMGVSLDDILKKWEQKVKGDTEGLFEGVQITTGAFECDIKKNFVLGGIPQYVLIGADNRIIRKNAPTPYTDEIYELITEHLNQY